MFKIVIGSIYIYIIIQNSVHFGGVARETYITKMDHSIRSTELSFHSAMLRPAKPKNFIGLKLEAAGAAENFQPKCVLHCAHSAICHAYPGNQLNSSDGAPCRCTELGMTWRTVLVS